MTTALARLGGWPAVLGPLTQRQDLTAEQTRAAMAEILEGLASPAQLAAFIVALRVKGETVDELTGLLEGLLGAAELVEVPADLRDRLVDTVGTGGDRSHSINVSTMAALVAAGGGVPIGKHGNRAASSSCGSADLLEALGVNLELDPDGIRRCLAEANMAFCFAPRFHSSLRHAGPTRRELGVPTAFNVLGPMANPLRVRRQVLGVANWAMAERMGQVLIATGTTRAMIVHGDGGLDELALSGPSRVLHLTDGEARESVFDPADLGFSYAPIEAVVGGDPATNAEITGRILAGEHGPGRDIVVINAAATLVVGEAVGTMAEGVELARSVLDDGGAARVLERLVAASSAVR